MTGIVAGEQPATASAAAAAAAATTPSSSSTSGGPGDPAASASSAGILSSQGDPGGPDPASAAASSASGLKMAPVNFENFYNNVCAALQARGEVHSVSKVFSQLSSDEDRMRFILDKNFAQLGLAAAAGPQSTSSSSSSSASPPPPPPFQQVAVVGTREGVNCAPKNRSESQRMRNLGNQVYQKNRLAEALELYTQSICLAPHPPPPKPYYPMPPPPVLLAGGGGGGALQAHDQQPEVAAPDGSQQQQQQYEELALGYANRSAVLFQMKEFELCIRDITRAFDNSYPNNLMYKLFERKARCLKALKEYPRALESMKSAEMWMKYSTLNETKSSSFRKDVGKQVEFLEEKVGTMNISEFKNACNLRKNMSAPPRTIATPWLKAGNNDDNDPGDDGLQPPQNQGLPSALSNPEVPCARSNVRLEYSEECGRRLVATEDIPPGEIVIIETPYSAILLPEFYGTHCQSCLVRIASPIPCWFCSKVRFCSDVCRLEAWERFHKVECQQLDLMLDPTLGKMAMLAMRILTSSGKIYLDYIVGRLAEEGQSEERRGRRLAFNEEGIYDSADYRTIYSLVAHSAQRGVGDLFKRGLMALYLLKVLELTPFFLNGGSDPRNLKLGERAAMGAVLLRHLQNLPCNAHEVTEMQLPPDQSSTSSKEAVVHEVGAAVFSTLSLLNHSCDPNVVRHYYSSNSVVRTVRTVRKGEELLDNYGYHYAVMPKEERQRKLYNQYYFRCECGACAQNWPLYQNIPTALTPLPAPSSDKSSNHVAVETGRLSKQFRRAFDAVLQGCFEESIPILVEYLAHLDNHMVRPLRDFNDCQEALKQCYSATANVYVPQAATASSGGSNGKGTSSKKSGQADKQA